jgi:hypothetical protein
MSRVAASVVPVEGSNCGERGIEVHGSNPSPATILLTPTPTRWTSENGEHAYQERARRLSHAIILFLRALFAPRPQPAPVSDGRPH